MLISAYGITFWGFFNKRQWKFEKSFMEKRYRRKRSKLSGASQLIRIWTDVFVLQNRALESSGNFCGNICVQHSGTEEVLTVPSLTCSLRFSRDALIIFLLHCSICVWNGYKTTWKYSHTRFGKGIVATQKSVLIRFSTLLVFLFTGCIDFD